MLNDETREEDMLTIITKRQQADLFEEFKVSTQVGSWLDVESWCEVYFYLPKQGLIPKDQLAGYLKTIFSSSFRNEPKRKTQKTEKRRAEPLPEHERYSETVKKIKEERVSCSKTCEADSCTDLTTTSIKTQENSEDINLAGCRSSISKVKKKLNFEPESDEALENKIDSTTKENIAYSGLEESLQDPLSFCQDQPKLNFTTDFEHDDVLEAHESSNSKNPIDLKRIEVNILRYEQMPLKYYVGSLIAFAPSINGIAIKCQRCTYKEKFLSIEKVIEKLANHFEEKHSPSTWNGYCGICSKYVSKKANITVIEELEHVKAKHKKLLEIR